MLCLLCQCNRREVALTPVGRTVSGVINECVLGNSTAEVKTYVPVPYLHVLIAFVLGVMQQAGNALRHKILFEFCLSSQASYILACYML